jgi:hypothetical protein
VDTCTGGITTALGSCEQAGIGSLHCPVPVHVMNFGPFNFKPFGHKISARDPNNVPLGVRILAF